MNKGVKWFTGLAIFLLLPDYTQAQAGNGQADSLQQVLSQVYDQMLPLCSSLISVGRGIAGFAAIWYIAARVWRQLANAEPLDFYPLLRPFAVGLAILLFPAVIAVINGVLQPTVRATSGLVTNSDTAISLLLQQKALAIRQTDAWQMYVGSDGTGDQTKWYAYTHPGDPSGSGEGLFAGIGNDIRFAMEKASYNFRNTIKEWLSEVLQILFEAAGLCINTIRTFYLIVLAILGPLVFGLSVFDGFQYTLTVWVARYINVFLWLPVANIFGSILGKIQQMMLQLDIQQVQNYGQTFFSQTDAAYLIFLIIGIIGYCTVPSVANYIVHAGGGNGLLNKVNNFFSSTSRAAFQQLSGGGMVSDSYGYGSSKINYPVSEYRENEGYRKSSSGSGGGDNYLRDKLSGKSS